MQFTFPQFIERETKIVGPLTFRQFVYLGSAGAASVLLYFSVSFPVFLILSVILLGFAFALAFIKIGGRGFPSVLKNFFIYLFSSRVYFWKSVPTTVLKKEAVELKEEPKEESPLVINGKSRLRSLFTKIETKGR